MGISVVVLILGYVAGAVGGYFAVARLSSNRHDKSVEAAMTGAFVVGPVVAIGSLIFIIAIVRM